LVSWLKGKHDIFAPTERSPLFKLEKWGAQQRGVAAMAGANKLRIRKLLVGL
jgi:hypothetical protein